MTSVFPSIVHNLRNDLTGDGAGGDNKPGVMLKAINDNAVNLASCVASSRLKVSFEAGDLNIANVDVASSALPTGAATAANQATLIGHVDGVEGKLDALETTLTAIETDQAAIEVLHTATNSKIDTIDTVLDNLLVKVTANETLLTAANVDHAANEVLLGTIAGDTTSLDGKVTACNTGAVTIAASALPTGAATAANQATLIGHVDGVEGKLDVLETTLTAIETDQAALEVLHTATNSKLDTIDGVLDNLLVKVTANETLLTAANVDHAANEVLLGTIAGDTTSLDGKVTACNTGAVVVSSSALPSGAATAANQATLIGHLDGVEGKLDALETTLTAIETDQAALEVLHTATNSKLDTLDAVVDNIKAKTDLMSLTTTQTHNGVTIAGGADNTSSAIEITANTKSITIFVNSDTGSIGGSAITIDPQVSYDNSTFYSLLEPVDGSGNPLFVQLGAFYNERIAVIDSARFRYLKVKITNTTGTSADFDSFVSF